MSQLELVPPGLDQMHFPLSINIIIGIGWQSHLHTDFCRHSQHLNSLKCVGGVGEVTVKHLLLSPNLGVAQEKLLPKGIKQQQIQLHG